MRSRGLQLVCVLILGGLFTRGATQQAPDARVYVSRLYGWSISYPRDWTIDTLDPTFVKISNASPYGLVGIHSWTVEFRTLSAFADSELASYAASLGQSGVRVQTPSRRSIVLRDGTPAIEVVHLLGTGTVGKSREILALSEGHGFLVDVETYLESWGTVQPIFDLITKSFTVRTEVASGPGAPALQTQVAHPLPTHALILGVPFISWDEAAKLDYHDKQILNPSVPASLGMVLEYWGQNRSLLAKDLGAPPGWTSTWGEDGTLDSLRSLVSRGIPIVVNLAMTPAAHQAEPNAAAMATLIGSGELASPSTKLTQHQWEHAQPLLSEYGFGIWSGVLGKMVPADTLRRWGEVLGIKTWQESVLQTRRVVIGYDDQRNVVILHDPSFGPAWEVSYDDLERMWALFDHDYVASYPTDYATLLATRSAVHPYASRTVGQRAAENFVFGYALASVGRLAEAQARFQAGLAAPGLPKGYQHLFLLELARLAEVKGDTADAISGYERAGALIPQHHRPWLLLSRLYERSDRAAWHAKAVDLRRKAEKLCEDPKAREAMQRALPHDFTMMGCAGLLPL